MLTVALKTSPLFSWCASSRTSCASCSFLTYLHSGLNCSLLLPLDKANLKQFGQKDQGGDTTGVEPVVEVLRRSSTSGP